MRNTHITFVMDRSGSMASCASDAEGGLNSFIADQRKLNGDNTFTLVHFDTVYDIVYNGLPLKKVETYKFEPRGGTALLDAVGRAINETGKMLSALSENERPEKILFVIFTDGQENASHEFTRKQVKEMIEHQTNKYNWQFVYMGANQDAFAEAGGIGILRGSTVNFDSSPIGTKKAFNAVSCSTQSYVAGNTAKVDSYFGGKEHIEDGTV